MDLPIYHEFTMNLPGKSVKKNLNKPERRQFRKEVALAADIFMRLTLLKFLSMMCAVALEVTNIKKAVEHAPRRKTAF
jgi:hypothetical protein